MSQRSKVVSSAFTTAFARKATAFAEAKKAENTLGSLPFPIGTQGLADVIEIKASATKNTNTPVITLTLLSVDPTPGKRLKKEWYFSESEKASFEQRTEWFLNEMEAIGLPREVREQAESIEDVIDWVDQNIKQLRFNIVKDEWAGNPSGKKMYLNPIEDAEETATTEKASVPQVDWKVGDICKYMSSPHEILGIEGTTVKLRSNTGRERQAQLGDLMPE